MQVFLTVCFYSQEANQNHTARQEKAASPVHSQPERDVDNYKETQILAMQKLEHQMKKQVSVWAHVYKWYNTWYGTNEQIFLQDKKWETRLQEIKAQHESEKNQVSFCLGYLIAIFL